jgi:hypothetical protein
LDYDNHCGEWWRTTGFDAGGKSGTGRSFAGTAHLARTVTESETARPNDDQNWSLGNGPPGANSAGCGNEGVGEHVRIRFHLGIPAGETAEPSGFRTERRNLWFLLPDRVWEAKLPEIRSSRLT